MTGRANVGRWLFLVPATALLLGPVACGRAEPPAQPAKAEREATATGVPDPGGDATSSVPAGESAPDACDLVTDQEAAALTRLALGPKQAGQQSCTWTAPAGGPTGQVEVYVGDGAKKIFEIERELGHELRTLSGAGDEAYLDTQANEVFVSRAGTWVAIRLVLLNDPKENHKPLEDLIRVVAGRL